MKKIFSLSLLVFISVAAFCQGPAPVQRATKSQPVKDAYVFHTLGVSIPKVTDTASGLNGGQDSLGLFIQIRSTGLVYHRDTTAGGHKWTLVGSGGGSSYVDPLNTRGQTIFRNATSTVALNGNSTAAKQLFMEQGTGSLPLDPSWYTPTFTDIANWQGYTSFDLANLNTSTALGGSNTQAPSQFAVKSYVDNAISGIPAGISKIRVFNGAHARDDSTIVLGGTLDTTETKIISDATHKIGIDFSSDARGDLHPRGSDGFLHRLAIGGANTVIHGGTDPSYSAVVEADQTLANNTTNNVSITKHGYAPILPNDATKYLDGTGAYTVPAGGGGSSFTRQIVTSGASTTVTGGNYILTIDPSSQLAAHTVTLPASPSDKDIVKINFGGTLKTDAVILAFYVSPNTSQSILDNVSPQGAPVYADDEYSYQYRTATTTWYRIKGRQGFTTLNVNYFGAYGDGVDVTDAGITASGSTLTSATAGFKSTDIGKSVMLFGSGTAGANQTGTITGFTNSTTVTVSFTAVGTVSSKEMLYGTDCVPGIQAAINSGYNYRQATVQLPYNSTGLYLAFSALTTTTAQGFAVNSQLYIPQDSVTIGVKALKRTAITIQGEFPPSHVASGILGNIPLLTKAVIIRSVITGTGLTPSILSSPAVPDNFSSIGETEMYIRNLVFMVYTNQGTVAPTMGCINGALLAKQGGDNIILTVDIAQRSAPDPSGNEKNFGWIVGHVGDDGPNRIDNISVNAFKYGIVASEHTIMNGVYVYGCIYAFTFSRGDNDIQGNVFIGWCKYPFYIPSTTAYLDGNQSAGGITVGINAVIEIMDSASRWYGSSGITNRVLDSSNFCRGYIRQTTVHIGGVIDETDNFAVYNAQLLQIQSIRTGNIFTNNNSGTHGYQSFGVTSKGVDLWYNTDHAQINVGSLRIQDATSGNGWYGMNVRFTAANFKYDSAGTASWLQMYSSGSVLRQGVSGSIGATITPLNQLWVGIDGSAGLGGTGGGVGGGGYALNINTSSHILLGTAVDNGILTAAGNISPEANATRDLGTSSFVWSNLWSSTVNAKRITGTTGSCSIAAGAAAGTSPTVTLPSSNNLSGNISVTAGSAAPAGGIIATITVPTQASSTFKILISCHGSAGVPVAAAATSTTTFTINTADQTFALVNGTNYQWDYLIIQ